MYNLKKYSDALELNKVLEKLAELTSISDAKNSALEIIPSFDINTVTERLKNTDDAYILTAKYPAPSFGRIENMNYALERVNAGGTLSMAELLKIAEILRVTRSLKQWRNNCEYSGSTSIDKYFDVLTPNTYFEEKITSCIKSQDEMSDTASPELASIRRIIISTTSSIRQKLESSLHTWAKNDYLQENIITQRDGRFVIPVKAEYRKEVKGIVHDTSASGATIFIEPMTVVEANNKLRMLSSQERDEIERILIALSKELQNFASSISISYNALVDLDLIFAKANLAYKMKASMPSLNTTGEIHLKNARHPLIDERIVVPITVSLGKDFDTLIITGANTGGKTVTLKTVGLITLMAMCGLMIPCDDASLICCFEKILVDIGDEQSIEQSLSTFSSHMVNTVSILNEASNNTLVLLDELGAGTDPVEGSALAKSILVELNNKGAKVIATTHYAELKAYAIETENVENACCEFDVQTLKPTYRLLVGIPGSSNAFAISKRLGLNNEIIERANGYINQDDLKFERIAKSLEKARVDAEKEKDEITKLRLSLSKEKEQLENELLILKQKREKVIENTKNQGQAVLESARSKVNTLLSELEAIKKDINKSNSNELIIKARSLSKLAMNDIEDKVNPVENKSPQGEPLITVNLGDKVFVPAINNDAEVLQIKGNKIYVATGNINLWVNIDELRKSNNKHSKNNQNISFKHTSKNDTKREIDLRGLNSDEAIIELDKFIDNAVITKTETVTIIHGKGTGVLRSAVQSYLKKHKNVKSYRLGVFGEGENGVTLAELKK